MEQLTALSLSFFPMFSKILQMTIGFSKMVFKYYSGVCNKIFIREETSNTRISNKYIIRKRNMTPERSYFNV